ncbi:serine kinase [Ideonella sp. BN130291]|uniref:serine kinase n=1 Tax=Ideonella sp. BN130291 TaxID=3112940 RepID=UPI002E25A468|nr:serine kinase [Ideonella sp. BN130291]
MNDDWARLTRVREAQLAAAREAVEQERVRVQASLAQAQRAQAQLQQQAHAKSALWQDTTQALAQGGCGAGTLRQAQVWSGALDRRIADAGQGVQAAEQAVAERMAELQQRRSQLRHASSEVEKVRQVHQRLQAAERRGAEVRAEDRLDELAAQRWLRVRGS